MSRHDLKLVVQLFFRSARLQKKRATLTIASLAWGTVTILLLLAFGEGLKRQMQSNEQAMGSNLAILWPGETSKPYKGLAEGRPIRPRLEDVDYVRARMPDLDAAWGEVTSWRTALTYGRKTVNCQVVGTSPVYGDRRKQFPKPGGRFLDPDDLEEKRRVLFLGNELAKQLFGEEDPVGKTVAINNSPFTVIGVMQRKRQSSTYGGPDAQHGVIPETTFKALFGRDKLNVLVIRVKQPEEMDDALVRLNQVLGPRLGYDPEDPRVFGVWNTVEGQKMSMKILLGLELFFGIIGALTLIIGGVGVANIMYAVVKERTKEIGVKMAMGARRRWITGPFILEGLVYTLVGGLFGAFISIVIVTLLGLIPSEGNDVLEFLGKPTLSWPIGAATVAILGTAGLLAGYFPARRAASIDPAATLRYE
jgi:putative ABC transport system permease protein